MNSLRKFNLFSSQLDMNDAISCPLDVTGGSSYHDVNTMVFSLNYVVIDDEVRRWRETIHFIGRESIIKETHKLGIISMPCNCFLGNKVRSVEDEEMR